MSDQKLADDVSTPAVSGDSVGGDAPTVHHTVRSILKFLSFRNISALWVFAIIFLVFAITIPDLFLTDTTLRSILDEQALTAMVAIGLVLPLAAGVFDLSIGLMLGLGAMGVAWLLEKHGLSIPVSIVLVLGMGLGVGTINGLLVTRVRIDSFIATLGVGSCLAAVITAMSDGENIIGLPPQFQDIASKDAFGIAYPVFYMVILAVIVWFVLEHTPVGRRLYATGGNVVAARLSGVRTDRVIFTALVLSATIASFAGVLLTARIGSAAPDAGPSYLLPAFSAAFLGSTQFKAGRFNVWGTVLAVYVLATGVKGLQLSGAPFWLPEMFNGLALLLAVGLSKYQGRAHAHALVQRLLRRKGGDVSSVSA